MERNKTHITELQKLAEEGWKQMHETLLQHGLSSDSTTGYDSSKKRNIFLLFAACIFLIFIFICPFILNDSHYFTINKKANTQNTLLKKSIQKSPSEIKISFDNNKSTAIISQQRQLIHQKMKNAFLEFKKENFVQALQKEKKYFFQKSLLEKSYQTYIPGSDNAIDISIKIEKTTLLQKKPGNSFSNKVQLFAGVGINVTVGNNYSHSFNFNDLNIHPSITAIIPLTQKLNLHFGVSAFSTIHGKEVSVKEKELVSNISSNVYYDINTTSIIKTSYFELPLTLHYSISNKWTGSGVQLSKLYKVSLRKEKESFDYNNTLYAATLAQNNVTPTAARAAFQNKVEIKKLEPRIVAETNFQQGRFLFSAGYYYSPVKSIILKDGYNSNHQYRNEYFKLGIQYRIDGKK